MILFIDYIPYILFAFIAFIMIINRFFIINHKIPLELATVLMAPSLLVAFIYNFENISDKYEVLFKLFIIFSATGIFFFIPTYKSQKEVYKIAANLSVIGALAAISANNFLHIFLALELMTIPTYVIIYHKIKSNFIYFKYALLSSALEIFAISLIYTSTRSIELEEISYFHITSPIYLFGILILAIAFYIKLAITPSNKNNWLLKIFKTNNVCDLSFIVLFSKCTMFFIIYKIFRSIPWDIELFIKFSNILLFATITISSFLAIYQNNFRKMLAYIIIEHNSLLFISILSKAACAHLGTFILIISELITIFGLFIFLDCTQKRIIYLEDFPKYNSNLSLALSIIIISLAGIPPTLCFWGKYYTLLALFSDKNYFLAIALCFSMLFSCIYSLKILKNIWNTKMQNYVLLHQNKMIYFMCILQICLPFFISYLR